MSEPDYIVVRGTGDRGWDGTWYDLEAWRERADLDRVVGKSKEPPPPDAQRVALHPTGMIEVRDDGAVAEIWAPKDWKVPPE